MRAISPNNGHPMTAQAATEATADPPIIILRERLHEAAQGNVEHLDIAPIEALLAQGCDLEADILPTVARTVPELPRPLKNWGAQWLVREILEPATGASRAAARQTIRSAVSCMARNCVARPCARNEG
jgi:hypothetical protein